MGSFSRRYHVKAVLPAAIGALLVLALGPRFFAANADQGPTLCGADNLPVVPHSNAAMLLTPESGEPSSAFVANVSGIEMNPMQADQPADLVWEPGQAVEEVLTFGTYADAANSISIDGQVPANAGPGQHTVRVCWLYPPGSTWYYTDASFDVAATTSPTETSSPTPSPTPTPTPAGTGNPTPTPTATPGETPVPTPTLEPTPEFMPMMLGDADCDDGVDAVDGLLALRFAGGLESFGDCISSADVDDDRDIDSVDALFTLRHVAGLTVSMPIGGRPVPTPPQYSLVVVAEGGAYDVVGKAYANGVNASGEVVGETGKHAFFWDPAASPKLVDLGTLGGWASVAYGINDYHEVVGATDTSSAFTRAFHWDASAGMTDMGAPTGVNSRANDINSMGMAIGSAERSSDGVFAWDESGGMRYRDGSQALAINDWGVAVGSDRYGPLGWDDDGSPFAIGSDPSLKGGEARGVSFTNQVVGEALMKRKGEGYCTGYDCLEPYHEAFLWNKTKGMTDLGTLSSPKYCGGTVYPDWYACSGANDINMWNQAVGWSDTMDESFPVAVLWNKGKIEDLNHLIAPWPEGKLEAAKAINDQGLIVCDAWINPGSWSAKTAAVLLVPVVLQSLVIEPGSGSGGTTFTGRITLSDEAPIPIDVSLKSTSLAAYTSFPETVTIPRGATEVTFEIETSAVPWSHPGHLTASFGGWSVDAPMTITP